MGFIKKLTTMFSAGSDTTPAVKPGRNEECWCGSGKKYKKCHMIDDDLKQTKKYFANCGPTQ